MDGPTSILAAPILAAEPTTALTFPTRDRKTPTMMASVSDSSSLKAELIELVASTGDACDPDADDDGILNDPVSSISIYILNASLRSSLTIASIKRDKSERKR